MVKKLEISVIVLVIVLVVTVQYFIIQDWFESKEDELLESYMEGYEKGMSDAVLSLFEETQDCKLTTLTVNEFSRKLFDIECLQPELIEETP